MTLKPRYSFFAGQFLWPAFLSFTVLAGPVFAGTPSQKVFEHHHHTREQAITKIFGEGRQVSSSNLFLTAEQKHHVESKLGWVLSESSYVVWTVRSNKNELLGYAIVLDEIGKHQPITFLTAVSPDFKVKDYLLLVYREHRGDEVKKKRFRKQFWGLSAEDDMTIDIQIDGITGATISCWSIAGGVKKALLLAEVFAYESQETKN